jgi:uncharacterized SAM-dependent methyltransferase
MNAMRAEIPTCLVPPCNHYDNEGQQLIDYFKEYLTRANTLYQQRREATRLKAEADEQHQRQQDLDWHEHRDRIVNDLRP